ncbi:hypothetical protein CUJ84_pRLN4000139 (plasmid) [Rhizobium leguminosarum]|uniref:Glyoxalase/fosfomycin resistance/dioxygenase domain-containing protein n=1 Tax=Rhizobium leguminosarum TaxID=384 RepID=A0A2K9ZHZ7_RHILE|nr:hypothetical protein CUJ84_pRLN4000139 [Rhizobium leguminosarum]
MLKSFEHVGMTVGDMDRTVDFYCGLLGLSLVLRKTMANGMQVAFLDAAAACWRSLRRPAARRERSTCLTIRPASATSPFISTTSTRPSSASKRRASRSRSGRASPSTPRC